MADNIVDIVFSNIAFIDAAGSGHTASVTGTIQLDYSTLPGPTVTDAALSVSVDGAHVIDFLTSNSTFDEQSFGGDFIVQGTNGFNNLQVTYTGTQPTSLVFITLTLAGPGLALNSGAPPGTFTANTLTSTAVCFAAGTLIRTPRGDVPVESLQIGDLVLAASGKVRPVKWMGHRDLDFRRNPYPRCAFPVRIAHDAFGPNRPSQDLILSSGHSVCVDLIGEVFIPVGNLVNGATIAQIEMDEVSYWHVELDSHDILIANNLPAESYLAMANRGFFEERRGLLPAMLEGRERTHADFCRPVVLDGPILAFARQRLMERAEASGWTPSRDADLHLVVDGEVHRRVEEGGAAVFRFPASARDVQLLCNTFFPALVGHNENSRKLGVMLVSLEFGSVSDGELRQISLGDVRLRDGIHQLENHDGNLRRWTNGELVLDPQFWDVQKGQAALRVTYDTTTIRGWTAPAKVARTNETASRYA